jgi:hypothetical protein
MRADRGTAGRDMKIAMIEGIVVSIPFAGARHASVR